jgi:hypothetical protein
MMRSFHVLLFLAILLPSVAPAALTQSFQQTGNLGLEVAGAGGVNQSVVSGTLSVAGLPPGAIVQRAYLYASQNGNGTNPLVATFNGSNLGAVGPLASDPAFLTLYTYRWDVTAAVVPPLTSFGFTVTETVFGLGIAGIGLVVVWQDPAEPMRTITILDGMKQVGESGPESESVTFSGLPPGPTKAWTFTAYDDSAATGETVRYNGSVVGGPLDQNVGMNASVLQMTTTSASGSNTMSIQTGGDHLAWMVAATAVDLSPVGLTPHSWANIKALFR